MSNYTSTQWPPLSYPSPAPQPELITTPTNPAPPSSFTQQQIGTQVITPVVTTTTFTPTPPPTIVTTYQSPVTTQIGTYNIFGIIDLRLQTTAT